MSEPAAGPAAPTAAALVERQVRLLLTATPSYHQLPPDRQRQMATGMVRIGLYLAEPEGIPANRLPGAITAVPARSGANLLEDVNFPEFVAGLIEGVFQAIVDSSIQQMQAFAGLVAEVGKTVEQFAETAISDADGRDWLASVCPECFERETHSGHLRLRPGIEPRDAVRRFPLLRIDLAGPDSVERKLVPAARRRLAASRQQRLATMVLMGINRIVVTN